MNQKQILIGAGVIGLLGLVWYMSAGDEVVGGNSGGGGGGMALPGGGGGGMALPGGGEIVSSPSPVSDSTPQVGYNLAFPELQPVPPLPQMQTANEPLPVSFDTTKKANTVSGFPVNIPGGGTVYGYGLSKSYVDTAKSSSGDASKAATPGKSIAPGVTMAEPTGNTQPNTPSGSKKDENAKAAAAASSGFSAGVSVTPVGQAANVAAAVSAGFGVGLSSTPVGQAANAIGSVASGITSAIGGLFRW